jgi:hypothetical protein
LGGEAQTKVRVTIWQPYFAGYMLAIGQTDSQSLNILDGDTELQREVFTWPVEEDIWAGLTDDQRRRELSDKFINDFQPMLAPEKRNMGSLASFVADLREVALSSSSEWSTSSSSANEIGSPPVLINGLLALYHQLEWILDVFRDMPGASVSVR